MSEINWLSQMEQFHCFNVPWQQPNATEAYAAYRMRQHAPELMDNYLAYPWATWIDRVHRGLPQPKLPLAEGGRKKPGILCTVCQHIWALDYVDIFLDCGITDLFWSHAPRSVKRYKGLRIHPFPLYPVQYASHLPKLPPKPVAERTLLYGFIGAYDRELYLSAVREWILNLPQKHNAVVRLRSEWHYEQEVYREQVLGMEANHAVQARLQEEADEYVRNLQNTIFSLCPSGSGPNSIRIWEALAFGSIPVIVSDRLELPGDPELWKDAVVKVPETVQSVMDLPKYLQELSTDKRRVNDMQEKCRRIWDIYGTNNFVSDIVRLLKRPGEFLCGLAKERIGINFQSLVALDPCRLPLQVLAWRRSAKPNDCLLIEVLDPCPYDLLSLRWTIPLRLCSELLKDYRWSVCSLNPILENLAVV